MYVHLVMMRYDLCVYICIYIYMYVHLAMCEIWNDWSLFDHSLTEHDQSLIEHNYTSFC